MDEWRAAAILESRAANAAHLFVARASVSELETFEATLTPSRYGGYLAIKLAIDERRRELGVR